MNYENNVNAMYADPNAYIQTFKTPKKEAKKVVFQEPYENFPNHYINNNFKKADTNNSSNQYNNSNNHDCNCNHGNKTSNENNSQNFFSNFNFSNLMPMLNMFNKGGGGGLDLSSIMSMFKTGNSSNPLGGIFQNPEMLTNIGKMFTNLNTKKSPKKEITSTDYQISSYTRVD